MIDVDIKALNRLNKKLRKIEKELFKMRSKIESEAVQALTTEVNKVRNTIIMEMRTGAKTGEIYKRGKKTHQASAPGEYPAVDRGEFITSIFYNVDEPNLLVELGNLAGAPYGSFLEKGTDKMEPHPWLEPSVEKHEDKIVNHMGEIFFKLTQEPFEGL